MPEQRLHNVVGSDAGMPRARIFVPKAAGDSMACTVCPHQEIFRSSSTHKTPRSVRYDLENALVSLCDVWFGEIKPYLVRNNIKLHVNCKSAGGDQTDPAGGAAVNPRCDPGAAPDVRALFTLRHPTHSLSLILPGLRAVLAPQRRPQVIRLAAAAAAARCRRCFQYRRSPTMALRRRHRRAQPEPSWQVPRLCRTFTVLGTRPGAGTASRAVKTTSHPKPQPQPPGDFYRFIVPRRESVMKNKSAQTVQAPSVSRGCQSPLLRYRDPSLRRADSGLARTSGSNGSASPPPIVPPRIICRPKWPKAPSAEMPPLLQNDLIDIIVEGNEKRLKLLYSSSEKNDRDHPSFMNLILNSRQEKADHKKLAPWR